MDHLESLECISKAINELERKENNHQKSLKIVKDIITQMEQQGADQIDTMASMKRIIDHQIGYLQIIAERFTE